MSSEINKTDVSYFSKYYDTSSGAYYEYLVGDKEHYRLLTWLATRLESGSIVLDIGSNYGHSALALAQNPNIRVLSYDTEDKRILFRDDYPNIAFHIQDAMTISDEVILSAKLIVFDTEHDGAVERRFFDKLVSLEYRGIVLFDDTRLNDGMREFWEHVTTICTRESNYISQDATNFAHFTGTGIVYFNPDAKILETLWELS